MKKSKITHVVSNSNTVVVGNYIKFVNENFDINAHEFLIVENGTIVNSIIQNQRNVKTVSTLKISNLYRVLKHSDKVIFHYLQLTTSQMLVLLFFPTIFNKLYWVAWGADLYEWRKKSVEIKISNTKLLIKNIIGLSFRKRIKYFVGIFPPDIDCFKKEFNSNAETFYASYVGNLYSFPDNNKYKHSPTLEHKISNNDCINIQIGHSCSKALNHIEVLHRLSRFKDENIRIYLPLSYGDENYGDLVEQKAKNIFGEKSICIRQLMPKSAYLDYLSTIDIAVFNTTRQIGLGNISPMLYMEKKSTYQKILLCIISIDRTA